MYSEAVHLSIYKTLVAMSLVLTFSPLLSYYTVNMPRSRSHSTSSLPGNIMASWSVHSYSAPRVENEVKDLLSDIPYSTRPTQYVISILKFSSELRPFRLITII